MKKNLDLLNLTLAYIEANPKEWDQSMWFCKTGCCFAGTAALLAGWNWVRGSEIVVKKKGVTDSVDYVATVELGLTETERYGLFDPRNTLKDLQEKVAKMNEENGP